VENITLDLADTEYVHILPNNCRGFALKTRVPGHTIKLASVEGQSNTTYLTLKSGYWKDFIGVPSLYLYLQSPDEGCVVELECWN
jgi:hypothetical protein